MVSGVKDIDRSCEDQKLTDSVRVFELDMIKNDAYRANHATKDK